MKAKLAILLYSVLVVNGMNALSDVDAKNMKPLSKFHHSQLNQLRNDKHPFSYNLGIKIVPSNHEYAQVVLCCHGYGHNNTIAESVKSCAVNDHAIGFNFPDYNITSSRDHYKSSYGTIHEILPLLYMLKRCIVDLQIPIKLYGFSAGGGAIINALAILNQNRFDKELAEVNISLDDKALMLDALQKTLIVLDCPLKSIEEISSALALTILASRYKDNMMDPIDALHNLQGLSLNILLHFQNPDDILSNRDDALFIERLQKVNSKPITFVQGNNGSHNAYNKMLWKHYAELSE